jgi:hypothetical protein
MAQAMVLRAQNRFNEAIRAYDAVLTLNRNFVPAYANIAYASSPPGRLRTQSRSSKKPSGSVPGIPTSALGMGRLGERI